MGGGSFRASGQLRGGVCLQKELFCPAEMWAQQLPYSPGLDSGSLWLRAGPSMCECVPGVL